MKLSNKKPPKNTRCDTKTVDYESKQPKLKGCPNLATIEVLGVSVVGETWLCSDCYSKLKNKK